jgi:glutamate-ammonia-ligase adenylyltransferase
LADAVLSVTLEAVWRSIKDRPMLAGDVPAFAIVAYGKLGGKELGYVSDLDLIFLFDAAADATAGAGSAVMSTSNSTPTSDDLAEVYTRLARRLVTWMTTATGAGQLYDIDLRLRPNGSSGLMVTPLDGFRRYQTRPAGEANTAWVWEHQAITRARFCAGDVNIGAAFESIRATVVSTEREAAPLAGEIVAMRERAREGHAHRTGLFDLKHDRGGMVDIEFIVQYLVLLHAARHRALIGNLGNIALLKICAGLNILTSQEAETVGAAYRRYRALQHRLRLDGISDARVPAESVAAETGAVRALWQRILGPFGPSHALDFGAGAAKGL